MGRRKGGVTPELQLQIDYLQRRISALRLKYYLSAAELKELEDAERFIETYLEMKVENRASPRRTNVRIGPDKTFAITVEEYEDLLSLQRRKHWSWPAAFSVNKHRELWVFTGYGWTRHEDREPVWGVSPIVDEVAEEYLWIRPSGGRFFIDHTGAYYKDVDLVIWRIANFQMVAYADEEIEYDDDYEDEDLYI